MECGKLQGYSRDVAGGVREVVCRCHDQSHVPLLGLCGHIVDDISSPRLDIIGFEVSHRRNVGVSSLAVVTLVVVVGQNLPIVVSVHLPSVVEDVVIEVEVLILLLGISAGEVVFPRYLWCVFGVKVDPNEAVVVNVLVNTEQPVLGLVETLKLLVARSLCEVPTETVGPAMVSVRDYVSPCKF